MIHGKSVAGSFGVRPLPRGVGRPTWHGRGYGRCLAISTDAKPASTVIGESGLMSR